MTAFQACGIKEFTFNEWLDKGEQGKKPYSELADMIKRAAAAFEVKALQQIERAGLPEQYILQKTVSTTKSGKVSEFIRYAAPQWQAQAWILERTRNDRYGERSNLTLQFSRGVELVKRIQKAREQKAIAGEFRVIEEKQETKQLPTYDAARARMAPACDIPERNPNADDNNSIVTPIVSHDAENQPMSSKNTFKTCPTIADVIKQARNQVAGKPTGQPTPTTEPPGEKPSEVVKAEPQPSQTLGEGSND